jgi:hypothetical protein
VIFRSLKQSSYLRQTPLFRFFCLSLTLVALFVFEENSVSAANWQADFTIRVSSPRTQPILFNGIIYQEGTKVRIEAKGSEEIDLFDFEARVGIRIFPEDRIYFTSILSEAKVVKAIKEAWIPAPKPYQESLILLWKGDIRGKAARLYFVTLELKGRKAYQLRWVTDDLNETPLRIIYPGPANETVIVDYDARTEETLPNNHFEPPQDYLSLNPF